MFFETIQDEKSILANSLDSVDVPLHGTRAPVNSESGVHCQPIALKVAAEAAQLWRPRALNIRNPLLELGAASLANKDHKSLRQSSACGQLLAAGFFDDRSAALGDDESEC